MTLFREALYASRDNRVKWKVNSLMETLFVDGRSLENGSFVEDPQQVFERDAWDRSPLHYAAAGNVRLDIMSIGLKIV